MNESQNLEKIINIAQNIESINNLLDFETIEIPFNLAQKIIEFGKIVFTSEVLQQLGNQDPETLDAWAIALKNTLEIELNLLNNWLIHLSRLSIPPILQEKLEKTYQQIQQIGLEKTEILTSTETLRNQENILKQQLQELQELKQKTAELKQIEQELQKYDLNELREEVKSQTASLIPQKQTLDQLQQEKEDIEAKIATLYQQKQRLDQEINTLKNEDLDLQNTINQTGCQLIILQDNQINTLQQNLTLTLNNIQTQHQEKIQLKQELQTAIDNYEEYKTQNSEIRQYLDAHYQTDQEIGKLLPMNQPKLRQLCQAIQQNLADFDQELSKAQKEHEQSQQKQHFTFG